MLVQTIKDMMARYIVDNAQAVYKSLSVDIRYEKQKPKCWKFSDKMGLDLTCFSTLRYK